MHPILFLKNFSLEIVLLSHNFPVKIPQFIKLLFQLSNSLFQTLFFLSRRLNLFSHIVILFKNVVVFCKGFDLFFIGLEFIFKCFHELVQKIYSFNLILHLTLLKANKLLLKMMIHSKRRNGVENEYAPI